MCGIVGYSGYRKASDVLIKGLTNLEYRGYDSAGIAVLDNTGVHCIKTKGKVESLSHKLNGFNSDGSMGIGHTRWATHGTPSDQNAHPHTDCNERFFIVHNGIIENYEALKNMLIEKGHTFSSETDTEVIAHLLEEFYTKNLIRTLVKVRSMLAGSYALAILDKEDKNKIVVTKKDSPLVIGLGEKENLIASDIPAILEYTNDFYILENGETGIIQNDSVSIYDNEGNEIKKDLYKVDWNLDQMDKRGYEDYMLKEIHEQPNAIRKTLESYLLNNKISLPLNFTKEEICRISRITLVACGTASYACKVGEYILEELTGIPTKVEVASEYRYKKKREDPNNLVIFLSQSGETADTLANMREAVRLRSKVIGVTNVQGSTLSREVENVLHTFAGPEIAVASTKAFTCQLLILYLVSLYLGEVRGTLQTEDVEKYINILKSVPFNMEKILEQPEHIQSIAIKYAKFENMFFIGRLSDYPIALEGSHKLKEISYIHAEAYEAGELKHGALALITSDVPVVCLSTIQSIYDKMKSNMMEVLARNAMIINVRCESIPQFEGTGCEIVIPDIDDLFKPILSVIPLQLFAYYISKNRGCNVDKPRNLAKSVTVE